METDANEKLETFRKQWKKELSKRGNSKADSSHFNSPSHSVAALKGNTTDVPVSVPSTEAQCAIDNSNRCSANDDLISSCLISVKTSPAVREHLLMLTPPPAQRGIKNCDDKHTKLADGLSEIRSPKRHSGAEYTKHKLKRLKHQKLEDIFLERLTSDVPVERLLDRLISDIDEITEIPFFDISLPKEVAVNIFQYLSMQDLCHCAQVSKSWNRLSEDELLWCKICHQLGFEKIYTTREKTNWKSVVQHNVKREQTLFLNWKNFNGKLSSLEHAKGKILTAVHSYMDTIVAGYTNGDVKLWNLSTEETVLFKPSSTSLLIREETEAESSYVQANLVHSVQTAGSVTAAVYTHGNIDIWDMKTGAQVLQTHHPKTGYRFIPKCA